jgi:hypothetical protein
MKSAIRRSALCPSFRQFYLYLPQLLPYFPQFYMRGENRKAPDPGAFLRTKEGLSINKLDAVRSYNGFNHFKAMHSGKVVYFFVKVHNRW